MVCSRIEEKKLADKISILENVGKLVCSASKVMGEVVCSAPMRGEVVCSAPLMRREVVCSAPIMRGEVVCSAPKIEDPTILSIVKGELNKNINQKQSSQGSARAENTTVTLDKKREAWDCTECGE